jgi:hypothetical protein
MTNSENVMEFDKLNFYLITRCIIKNTFIQHKPLRAKRRKLHNKLSVPGLL